MNTRDLRLTDHGICASARKLMHSLDDWQQRCGYAADCADAGDTITAIAVCHDLARELRTLRDGCRLMVDAFDAGNG